ncbi:Uncharacterized protein PBTT_01456 [Plasmodiophora brassicae]
MMNGGVVGEDEYGRATNELIALLGKRDAGIGEDERRALSALLRGPDLGRSVEAVCAAMRATGEIFLEPLHKSVVMAKLGLDTKQAIRATVSTLFEMRVSVSDDDIRACAFGDDEMFTSIRRDLPLFDDDVRSRTMLPPGVYLLSEDAFQWISHRWQRDDAPACLDDIGYTCDETFSAIDRTIIVHVLCKFVGQPELYPSGPFEVPSRSGDHLGMSFSVIRSLMSTIVNDDTGHLNAFSAQVQAVLESSVSEGIPPSGPFDHEFAFGNLQFVVIELTRRVCRRQLRSGSQHRLSALFYLLVRVACATFVAAIDTALRIIHSNGITISTEQRDEASLILPIHEARLMIDRGYGCTVMVMLRKCDVASIMTPLFSNAVMLEVVIGQNEEVDTAAFPFEDPLQLDVSLAFSDLRLYLRSASPIELSRYVVRNVLEWSFQDIVPPRGTLDAIDRAATEFPISSPVRARFTQALNRLRQRSSLSRRDPVAPDAAQCDLSSESLLLNGMLAGANASELTKFVGAVGCDRLGPVLLTNPELIPRLPASCWQLAISAVHQNRDLAQFVITFLLNICSGPEVGLLAKDITEFTGREFGSNSSVHLLATGLLSSSGCGSSLQAIHNLNDECLALLFKLAPESTIDLILPDLPAAFNWQSGDAGTRRPLVVKICLLAPSGFIQLLDKATSPIALLANVLLDLISNTGANLNDFKAVIGSLSRSLAAAFHVAVHTKHLLLWAVASGNIASVPNDARQTHWNRGDVDTAVLVSVILSLADDNPPASFAGRLYRLERIRGLLSSQERQRSAITSVTFLLHWLSQKLPASNAIATDLSWLFRDRSLAMAVPRTLVLQFPELQNVISNSWLLSWIDSLHAGETVSFVGEYDPSCIALLSHSNISVRNRLIRLLSEAPPIFKGRFATDLVRRVTSMICLANSAIDIENDIWNALQIVVSSAPRELVCDALSAAYRERQWSVLTRLLDIASSTASIDCAVLQLAGLVVGCNEASRSSKASAMEMLAVGSLQHPELVLSYVRLHWRAMFADSRVRLLANRILSGLIHCPDTRAAVESLTTSLVHVHSCNQSEVLRILSGP